MRLIVIRHGETACNINDVWHGWDDCALTEVGLDQAGAAAERLAGEHLDAIYSSDSRRARQTASAIARSHDLVPIPDPSWRERNAGKFEGMGIDDVLTRHPTVWEERAADYWGWRPPGGESFREVLTRTLTTVERLRAHHPDGTVAVATHMGPVRVLMSHFGGIPLEETYQMHFPSTGISVFTLHAGQAQAEMLNDDSHVTGER